MRQIEAFFRIMFILAAVCTVVCLILLYWDRMSERISSAKKRLFGDDSDCPICKIMDKVSRKPHDAQLTEEEF